MLKVFSPLVDEEEILAAAEVMRSGWLGHGPRVVELERIWASRMNVPAEQIVATTCASEGLFQTVATLDLDYGDEVIVPALSFPAQANAVRAHRGTLVFCDVDAHNLMPTWAMIDSVRSSKSRAVVLLQYGGWVAPDMAAIAAGCAKYNLTLIEDAACAPAAGYQGRPAGTLGDFGVWSFDAMKIITGGDGGLIYAADSWQAERIRRRINLGLSNESGLSRAAQGSGWWQFEIYEYGRRALMNDLTAAIILEQIKKLDNFVTTRRYLAHLYRHSLDDLAGRLGVMPGVPADVESCHYFFWIQTPDRDELAAYLLERDIYTTFRYYPLTRTSYRLNSKNGSLRFPGADFAADTTLCLPLHQGMTSADVEMVSRHIHEFYLDQ